METFQSLSPIVDGTRGRIVREDDGGLKAPEHIVMTPSAARALYSMIREQNLPRFALWAAIEGLIGGNPPYNQDDLDRHGLGHMTNYNDLSATSRWEKECIGYFNLVNQTDCLVKINLELPAGDNQEGSPGLEPEAYNWAEVMSQEFHRMLRRWKSFPTMMGTHMAQLSKLGMSVLVWNDERDWRPRTVELYRFLVPNQTYADLDQLTFCFFETDFTAQYLFQCYSEISKRQTKDENVEPGFYENLWNVHALEQILLFRANTVVKANNRQFTNFVEIQVALQNGDFTFSQLYGDGIKLVTLLYQEYDGKISHYIFDFMWQASTSFVFLADRQYHDFSQACAIFTGSPNQFTLHGNRGIGHKVFSPCQAKNQLACSMVDMGRYSATPMLRNNSGSVKDPQQVKLFPGVATDIGASEFVQNNLGANLPGVINVLQYVDQNLSVNLGNSGEDPGIPDASNASVSPTQAHLQSAREFNILRDRAAHFYNQLDAVYRNILSIVLRSKDGFPMYEEAARFIKRCIQRGVPKEVFEVKGAEWGLPDHIDIKAARVAGDGSTVGLLLGLQSMSPVLGSLPAKASAQYIKDTVLAALGPDALGRYTDGMEDPDEVSGGASLAGTENAIMQAGFTPIFSPSNEHKSHFAVHMALNAQVKQQVQQQQIDPIQAQKTFDHSIPHTGEHWQFILKSPFGQSFISKWKKSFDEVVQYATLNKKNAEKMYEAKIKAEQEAAQKQNQVLNEEQLKNLQAQGNENRKNAESEAKIARQDRQSEVTADLKKRDLENKASNDRLKTQVDGAVKREKNSVDAQLERDRQALADLTTTELP